MVRSLTDDNLDGSDRKLLSDIDRVGWHVIMILEGDGTPGWSFSVGLFETFKHPEVVVFGLPLELSGQVINGIDADIQKGKTFESGQEYPDVSMLLCACARTGGASVARQTYRRCQEVTRVRSRVVLAIAPRIAPRVATAPRR